MSELEDKKKSKRGRQPKYTTKQLMEYIEHYVEHTEVIGQIDASKLARYIKSTFGIEFDYRYFNRNAEVKEYIERLNHAYNYERDRVSKEIMLTFNPDKLVDTYKNDTMMLKQHLRGFSTRYDEMSERVKEYKEQCLIDRHEIQKLRESIEELKKQNTTLRAENKELKDNVSVLKKFKKFDESIQILKYLEEQNIIKTTNIETFKAVLSHCKLIKLEDSYANEMNIDIDYNSSDNEEEIVRVDDTFSKNFQGENVIDIKDIVPAKKNNNTNLKSSMSQMKERLKKK